jgi:exosortase/archaeosortase family protein
VAGTGALAHFFGNEVAQGFFHTFSGWVVFVVAFFLLFSLDVGLRALPDGTNVAATGKSTWQRV